jgi:hypothetical protein
MLIVSQVGFKPAILGQGTINIILEWKSKMVNKVAKKVLLNLPVMLRRLAI